MGAMSKMMIGFLVVGLLAYSPVQPTLKDAFKQSFLIGAALNRAEIYEQDARATAIVREQFNTISPENILKWGLVHPEPDRYAFEAPDRYVDFGTRNHMAVIGHTLVWHNQTPKWVFENSNGKLLSRDELLQRMREHIQAVVGRYKGRIKGWDVVNEALNDDGSLRQSPWLNIIGEDYIAKAFEFAHEADPSAELYYNDYDLEIEAKRAGAVGLVKRLKAQGIPITAVGLQCHNSMKWPSLEQEDATIEAFAELGVKVNITELDIDILPPAVKNLEANATLSAERRAELNPYKNGLPEATENALSKRYADLFGVFMKHRDVIERVTFWGVTDAGSWLNNWPLTGRTSYPLLFDREGKPKPAFEAVIKEGERGRGKGKAAR